MATQGQPSVFPNFVDKRRVPATGATLVTTPANFVAHAALDTRLTAINSGYYTAARLQGMTFNDKVYAVRLNDESGSI